MILICVGLYPGSCFFGKNKQNKICGCFSLSFCGSIWEIYYYDGKKNKKTSEKEDDEAEEETEEVDNNNFMEQRHEYNMRDRKKNLNFTEEELIF